MWSKGAVVIIKRGDEAMADIIAKGLNVEESVAENADEIENLKMQNYFLKKRVRKTTDLMIQDARVQYGYNWTPPKWANHIVRGFALIVYGVSIFVDKFMRIKGDGIR
jgi:hypothetical protein